MSRLTVTTIQTKLFWEDSRANLQMLEEKIRSIEGQSELVILPEMFSTGFSMRPEALAEGMEGETVNWMKRIARERRIILTGSIIICVTEDGKTKYHNRLIWMLPTGEMGYYDKRHAFAFAGEDQVFTSGDRRLIASVKGWKINLQVCYDLRFPIWARQSLPKTSQTGEKVFPGRAEDLEYDLLVYVANWPERRNHAWTTLLQARAIENQCYVIGVNRVGDDGNGIYHSGDSMVVDPLGRVLYTRAHEEDIHSHVLEKEQLLEIREKFPFWRDADPFMLI